jgi:arginine deiminase
VDLGRAQAEHDAFVALLRAQGVEVLYVEQLLAEVIERHRRRERLLDLVPANLRRAMHARLTTLSPGGLARALIGGIPEAGTGAPRPDRTWRLDPLPNLMFTRDPSAWIGRRVLVGAMRARVRWRESRLMDLLYRRHPRFLGVARRIDAAATPFRVEGGDVLVAGPGRVIVGISPRTSPAAAHRFASALLTTEVASEVLTLHLPRRAGFHLDLVLSIVDRETFAVWEPARGLLRAHEWRATSGGVAVRAIADPFGWLSPSSRIIGIDAAKRAAHGRAWDHGVNVLTIAPGVVIAYADNHEANARLRAAGIEVIPASGKALGRGRGGPRCLTCPIARDAVTS